MHKSTINIDKSATFKMIIKLILGIKKICNPKRVSKTKVNLYFNYTK